MKQHPYHEFYCFLKNKQNNKSVSRNVHHTTILNWARKYGEMKIKTKREDWAWLWHVMDSETRYMVANLITKHREKDDAKDILSSAKTHSQGEKPELVIIDGLQSYHEAFNEVLRSSPDLRACRIIRSQSKGE